VGVVPHVAADQMVDILVGGLLGNLRRRGEGADADVELIIAETLLALARKGGDLEIIGAGRRYPEIQVGIGIVAELDSGPRVGSPLVVVRDQQVAARIVKE